MICTLLNSCNVPDNGREVLLVLSVIDVGTFNWGTFNWAHTCAVLDDGNRANISSLGGFWGSGFGSSSHRGTLQLLWIKLRCFSQRLTLWIMKNNHVAHFSKLFWKALLPPATLRCYCSSVCSGAVALVWICDRTGPLQLHRTHGNKKSWETNVASGKWIIVKYIYSFKYLFHIYLFGDLFSRHIYLLMYLSFTHFQNKSRSGSDQDLPRSSKHLKFLVAALSFFR